MKVITTVYVQHTDHSLQVFKVSAMLETYCQSLSTSITNPIPGDPTEAACEQQTTLINHYS